MNYVHFFACNGMALNASNSSIRISNCSISELSNLQGESNDIELDEQHLSCRFDGSLVAIQGCDTIIDSTTFANASIGAVSVIGGNSVLADVTFINNTVNLAGYNNVRRNIMCENGSQTIDSYSDETGKRDLYYLREEEYIELWIQSYGCSIHGLVNLEREENDVIPENVTSNFSQKVFLFCRPFISSINRSENEDKITVRFEGANLLPCLFTFELFSVNTSNGKDEMDAIPLSLLTCAFISQNECIVEASKAQLQSEFNVQEIQIWLKAVLKLKEDTLSGSRSHGGQIVKTGSILLQDVLPPINDPSSVPETNSKAFP
ncbi:uncharacterized protein MONOS_1351 [Monocercomonoides exilis]|uniref:uncharacterized protein n=1 Tax=Monocercomonoides exilis TaxID=2049356 RepID=UPI003559F41B|nr:hypothetical protein MONOS_1351 [Monocercomonoides exilis]|eukprot:MONOS_1351.1-p1 / transcript=MONOS_1351.1 / gene=MONOS_1351 / organism=Monocercomonoides_exilis_PA203 / gene_product=unspecified product / transcript_product=unspecified product / location=Mono_scaffold00023:124872-125828(-) / protein_length=319 / sequence_SO=supercontig / SO=protein_coding / is_pseudo=false